jgi:hypothetical protein
LQSVIMTGLAALAEVAGGPQAVSASMAVNAAAAAEIVLVSMINFPSLMFVTLNCRLLVTTMPGRRHAHRCL